MIKTTLISLLGLSLFVAVWLGSAQSIDELADTSTKIEGPSSRFSLRDIVQTNSVQKSQNSDATNRLNASVDTQMDSESEMAVKASVRIMIGDESGTGFFVRYPVPDGGSEVFLVTAAHTLVDGEQSMAEVVVRDQGQRKTQKFLIKDENGNKLWTQHPSQDIAAIPFNYKPATDIYVFDWDQLGDPEHFQTKQSCVGEIVSIPSFPAKLESSNQGFPVLRQGTIASYPLFPVKEQPSFLLDFSAFGGDSGAPVIDRGDDLQDRQFHLIGLVTSQIRQTDKSVMPFEERIQHTPMGLGIAVNSAMIRETILMIQR